MSLASDARLSRHDLPHGFVFGAATAAYQIEGSGFGGRGPCHWGSVAATAGNLVRAKDGRVACDHCHPWPADLDLVKAAQIDGHRFLTSWARVMPDGRRVNPERLDLYERLVDCMLERGPKPLLTLYHGEMPSARADLGGWTKRDVAHWFADLAEVVLRRLAGRVAAVATIDAPWCVAWQSHFSGADAPGQRDSRAAARAMHHVLLANGAAIERLRAMGQQNPGIVLTFDHTYPASEAPADLAAADLWAGIFNRRFIERITRKTYPAVVLDRLAPDMPQGWQAATGLIGQKPAWLGVNCYTCDGVSHVPDSAWPSVRAVPGNLPKTQTVWEICPAGLESFLVRMSLDYVGDLPLHVTENGMANADVVAGGALDDKGRQDYLFAHLAATRRAMDQGANVKGFFPLVASELLRMGRGP